MRWAPPLWRTAWPAPWTCATSANFCLTEDGAGVFFPFALRKENASSRIHITDTCACSHSYASNPNTFRLKPISKPELPAEARCASPRRTMRTTFNMSESNFAPSPPKAMRATAAVTGPRNTVGSPGARVVRRVQGPFVYDRRNPQLI